MALQPAATAMRQGQKRFGTLCFVLLAGLAATLAPAGAARAQSLNDSVAAALNNNCAALGPARGSNLAALCAFPPSIGVSTPGADPTAAQSNAGGQDQETKIRKRLQELRGAEGPGATTPVDEMFKLGGLAGFVSFDYENVDKKTTNFTAGANSDKYGGTVGLDYSFGKLVIGGAFVFSRTDGTYSNSGGNFSTDSYGGYLYGSYLPIDNLYIDGVLGYAGKNMSLNRALFFTNTSDFRTARGTGSSSTNGTEARAGLSGGYDLVQGNLTFGPRIGVNYQSNTVGAFSESGSTGLELAFDSQSTDSLTTSIGFHGTMAFSTSFGVVVPQLSADYIHEFLDNQKTFSARFVQDLNASPTRISFQNDKPSRDYAGLGAGVVAVLPNGLSPFANYRALVGDSIRTTQTVNVGLRLEF